MATSNDSKAGCVRSTSAYECCGQELTPDYLEDLQESDQERLTWCIQCESGWWELRKDHRLH